MWSDGWEPCPSKWCESKYVHAPGDQALMSINQSTCISVKYLPAAWCTQDVFGMTKVFVCNTVWSLDETGDSMMWSKTYSLVFDPHTKWISCSWLSNMLTHSSALLCVSGTSSPTLHHTLHHAWLRAIYTEYVLNRSYQLTCVFTQKNSLTTYLAA